METTDDRIKILFFVPVWQRLSITEACYAGLKRIINHCGNRADCYVVTVYSETEHWALSSKYGFHPVYAENNPIGAKFNKGLEFAVNYLDWDYLFQLNSDDLLDNRLFDLFLEQMKQGKPFASIEKLYMYDTNTDKAMEYHYTLSGCGIRIIKRGWIEACGWQQMCKVKSSRRGPYRSYVSGETRYLPSVMANKPWVDSLSENKVFRLWEPDINKGLDNNSRNLLFGTMGEPVGWIVGSGKQPMVVDMKSDTNIWRYDQLQGKELDSVAVRGLTKGFPELSMVQRTIKTT